MIKISPSIYFDDKTRIVDFVIVYNDKNSNVTDKKQKLFRDMFEKELQHHGLQLEYDFSDSAEISSEKSSIVYVKIHATWEALSRQAEFLRLQMPIQESDLPAKSPSLISRILKRVFCQNPFEMKPEFKLSKTEMFTDVFDRRRESMFLFPDGDKSSIFSQAQRISLTWDIISDIAITLPVEKKQKPHHQWFRKTNKVHTTSFNAGEKSTKEDDHTYLESPRETMKTVDIRYLLKQQIYLAAYPIHDGAYKTNQTNSSTYDWSLRKYLHESWAKFSKWHSHQPLDEIRQYFGEKMAIYFAWLGFYTKMLILPAIIGLINFVFGLFSLLDSPSVKIFCANLPESNFSSTTVCPICQDEVCLTNETMGQHCFNAKLNTVFDNESTVFFSFFMAIWAILFLEFWKRRQAELCARWDVSETEFSEEKIRVEYKLNVTSTKLNPVTKSLEPYLQPSIKCRRVLASILGAAFFVLIVLALLAAVMMYKITGPTVWRSVLSASGGTVLTPQLMSSITASIANGVFIAIMTKVYFSIAWALTNNEYPRTESEFEVSYTYKIFIFQFVNFYGALFYLAFVRGKFLSAPNAEDRWESRCPITGCLIDVSIQLAIVMVGKQALNNLMEIGVPMFRNWWRRRKTNNCKIEDKKQWRSDFELDAVSPLNLSDDYLEMLIQYGFVTMFVAAFPLAPLFALLNNIIEIRLDAKKHLCETRRCIPVRAKDLGAWYSLLDVVTKIAVLTNGLLIAFTTDFIDRLVFSILYHDNSTNYANFLFSIFDVSDWSNKQLTEKWHQSSADKYCLYRDYRNPPWHGAKYEATIVWWTILVAKLIFVFIFEHLIIVLQTLLAYVIPDTPDHVIERQQREQHVQREMFMKQETVEDGEL